MPWTAAMILMPTPARLHDFLQIPRISVQGSGDRQNPWRHGEKRDIRDSPEKKTGEPQTFWQRDTCQKWQ